MAVPIETGVQLTPLLVDLAAAPWSPMYHSTELTVVAA